MTDQSMPAIPKVEELFKHVPHPRIAQRKMEKPAKTDDSRVGLNGKVALIITAVVGTMWAAYVFALISFVSFPAAFRAFTSGDTVTGITWLSQSFLQLILLPIIIVGQNVISTAQDARAEADHETLTSLHTINVQQLTILERQEAILDLLQPKS